MNSAEPEIHIVQEAKGIARPLFDSREDYEAFRERFAKAVKEREAAYKAIEREAAPQPDRERHQWPTGRKSDPRNAARALYEVTK